MNMKYDLKSAIINLAFLVPAIYYVCVIIWISINYTHKTVVFYLIEMPVVASYYFLAGMSVTCVISTLFSFKLKMHVAVISLALFVFFALTSPRIRIS